MSAVAGNSVGVLAWRRLRDRSAWTAATDFFLILVGIALPWSTSLVAIFVVAALVTMAPFFDRQAFLQSLQRPASLLPAALFALTLIGTPYSAPDFSARCGSNATSQDIAIKATHETRNAVNTCKPRPDRPK